ncbi:flavin prenyltransferase UbiX [Flocculibacter collagenilyticus]|uniref:flavin prenyltransferase UbiX n=1 Tax=Flocculibacter collagenilyticus TaxID=2744479 RepID=UPI0018F381AC|nr:flavin prenyltransferase UbiX [Flocculibacter collagenilyticus]
MTVKDSAFSGQITLAWTGASGAPYGLKLLEALLNANYQVFLLVSSAARVVFDTESHLKIPSHPERAAAFLAEKYHAKENQLKVFGKEEWFSPVASGSAAPKHMVVCPCSTSTLASIALATSDNLIERAADVVLKERGKLVLVPRETPYNSIHLEHMLKLSQLGAVILPASPGFYHEPKTIDDLVDFVVARILDHLGVDQALVPRWGYGH